MVKPVKILNRYELKKQSIERCHGEAVKAFAEHQVTQRFRSGDFASWRCQRPKSWVFGFDISVEPGRLTIAGDLGFCAWERTHDMIAWARSSIRDISYFAEKVPQEIVTREFSKEMAEAWLFEQDGEACDEGTESERAKQWAEIRSDLAARLDAPEHEFLMAVHDSRWVDGSDWPDFDTWRPRFLWQREAVRWFLENFDA